MSYIRVNLRGTLPGGEVWSVNPAFTETTDIVSWDQAAGQDAADAVAAVSVPGALNTLRTAQAAASTVRIERRSDSGVLIGAAEAPWPGTGGSLPNAVHPPQTSAVISLRSNTPGSAHRGRLYWPALGASLSNATLRLTTPTPQSVATDAATYLDRIATALKNALHPVPSLIDIDLCVVSPSTGTKTRIIRLEVGDILDVQRRRRDRMVENYSSAPMP